MKAAGSPELQKKLLEEYDSESRYREFGGKVAGLFVKAFAILVALYHLYGAVFGTPVTLKHRSLHVAMILALGFVFYPARKKASRSKAAWYDIALALLAASTTIYVFLNYIGIVGRAGMPNAADLAFAAVLIVLVLEGARRVTGWALPVLGVAFMLYAMFGRSLPGFFGHRGYSWSDLSSFLFVSTDGIYGTAVGVSASYIYLFILFGAFMEKSGMGQFFNDMALALAGHSKGGPAKVAVIASGFLGSINGAAVANVVTTGTFTIPLMKKTGYDKEFAGAVEASASVGGQLLPPIMGAAAFIMAEVLGIQYKTIAVAAILPALLYYIGIIAQVHIRAKKCGLEGIARENLPKALDVLKERGHLLIPLVFLVVMLFASGKTVIYSAFMTILVTIASSMLRKNTRMSLKDVGDALFEGTRSMIPVAIACASVGIIIGVASLTGFGLSMASAIVALGGKSLFLTLVFTMVACMILGMGLPSIPAYLITATMAAPALVRLGIDPLVSHLFVFYFAMFANITPPVALASFAAAGISGGSPMKTGLTSLKLSLAGFIVPFMFVYNDALLLRASSFLEGAVVMFTSIIGVIMLGGAIEGYLMSKMNVILRVMSLAGAILLMTPNNSQDLYGAALVAVVLAVQLFQARKARVEACEDTVAKA
ncbi:MAG: C4-dicarboxylate ABC transporter permease [Spirochaetae bacterium HGW-Spirochaetae-3]|jgi:TRAP transporter 4TM/12TM fusion protein|nr:MAG: C4-dicarboxylate ABC transporter permease [Spirochaetae bacterium HGW-Spirochaetae-3]